MAGPLTPLSPVVRAAAWMMGAVVSFTTMAVGGRLLAADLDTFEIMAYRSAIGVPIVVALAWAAGTLHTVATRRPGVHGLRNVLHFAGQNLWFYALATAPLAQVIALEFTNPIWVTLAAPLLLGERLTLRKLALVGVGFLGILLVARPGGAEVSTGTLAAAGAALGFAATAIVTKRLTRTETTTAILFWLVVMQLGLGVAFAGADGAIAWPAAGAWPWLLVVSCAGLSAHFCLTTALSLAPASVVVPLDFVRLPVAAAIGALAFGETLEPGVVLGGALIFAASYAGIFTAPRRAEASQI